MIRARAAQQAAARALRTHGLTPAARALLHAASAAAAAAYRAGHRVHEIHPPALENPRDPQAADP